MNGFISPSAQQIVNALDALDALDAWTWLDLAGKEPLLVTAFADVFFKSADGIWFLDTLEGKLVRVSDTEEELQQKLSTAEGQDHYLFLPFVQRAEEEGLKLAADECYDFTLHPVIGGEVDMENIEKRSFLVALHIRGQLHEQVRHLPEGTKISGFKCESEEPMDKPVKPWWKVW